MIRTSIPALLAAALLTSPAFADAHKWEISEIFSNADGTVQFVEWSNAEDDEQFLSLESVSTASGGFYAFPNDLASAATAGRSFLMATAGFAALPGAPAPDYVLPDGFLDPAGDTINYTGGDVVSFGALPMDGKSSITRNGGVLTNSPRNFAGQNGSIRLALAAIRNGSGVNRLCYTADAPVLGQTWNGTIDAGAGANVVAIVGYEGAASGSIVSGGELLLNLTSTQVFLQWQFSGGATDVLSQVVPTDTALLEYALTTQAFVLSPGVTELCNAVDLVLGH